MDEEKCVVELVPDKKYAWKLHLRGDCSKVLDEIHENQGPYGRRYLDDRTVIKPEKQAKATTVYDGLEET